MKIAYVVETFTEGLGYIDNILPRELGRLGHEVHLITCGLPPYYMSGAGFFGKLNETYIHQPLVEKREGFTKHLHRYNCLGNRIVINGLHDKLLALKPDVVVVRGISSFVLAQVIFSKIFCGFKIFTSTGKAYSSLPSTLRDGSRFSRARVVNFLTRCIPGRLFSFFVSGCVGSTKDCVDCVVDFYGVPSSKTHTISLGVDTSLFHPVKCEDSQMSREHIRATLGLEQDDILCIWTGRLTSDKLPTLLSKAVSDLKLEGYPIHALFIGAGPEEEAVKSFTGTTLLPFMLWSELPPYYRAADIAVWPRLITTSTLDASASGLPVIMSDQEQASERWEGIGLTYAEGDLQALKNCLLKLADHEYRRKLGHAGSEKMENLYSWPVIAKKFADLFTEVKP